jgi:transcriptional regulator with XRE-family HTH domain
MPMGINIRLYNVKVSYNALPSITFRYLYMTEIAQLIATIKRELKAQGLTYQDVARGLSLSEASVKRLFSSERLTVERLAQISQLLGFTLAELLQESSALAPRLSMLTEDQEARLVSNSRLLLVAVCAFNRWTLADIVAAYRISKAECLKQLLVLDRMGVIALLPGDRIRLGIARDFDWLPNGPIRHFFRREGLSDFLAGPFNQAHETLEFVHGMLTDSALAQLQLELRRLRSKFAALHEESASAPLNQRRGTGLLLASQEWEPAAFRQLRRPPVA